jgi:hypothetical protein
MSRKRFGGFDRKERKGRKKGIGIAGATGRWRITAG